MHEKLKHLLVGKENKYPRHLEESYPRVFEKIMELWGTPYLEAHLNDLMIADRPDRQGFPPEVMSELLFLSMLHDDMLARRAAESGDPWSNEETRRGLEEEHIEYSPHGLFRALESGNERAFDLFMHAGVDLEQKNAVGWTPLMIASFMGNEKIAARLLKAGASVTAHDNRGYTPLHWAAYQGFSLVIQALLDKGAPVNAKSEKGLSPLLQAAARGHDEAVRLLLSKGAFVNDADDEGWTPLHKAVANQHAAVVRLLMIAHADPSLAHQSGVTAFDLAKQKKNAEIFSLLASPPDEVQ